jgi:hypothetical protein
MESLGQKKRKEYQAKHVAVQRIKELPLVTQQWRVIDAQSKKLQRNMESPVQAQVRRETNVRKMASLQSMETSEQVQIRRINNATYMASKRSLSAVNLSIQNQNEVSLISRYVETEQAKQKAFNQIMKTKIGHDEVLSEEIRKAINKIIRNPNHSLKVQNPIYKQCHQANVCVCCDRFVCGTEEINWIHKGK